MNESRYVKKLKKVVKGHLIDRECKMRPNKISRADLKKRQEFYDGIVTQLVQEIHEYQENRNPLDRIAPSSEFLNYQIASYNGDRMGKVLIKDGEIYRGIYRESCDDFLELWNTGVLQVLGRRGWIPETDISAYSTKEYGLILRHKTVEMSASNVWTYSMLKDACIHAILINEVLKRFGFKLHDGHLNNLTFHEGVPLFTDIGSIVKDRGQINFFEKELVFSGCYRLLFLQMGNCLLARIQAFDENNNAIWIFPRTYNDNLREYRSLLKQYKRNWRFRRFSLARRIVGKVFDAYEVPPEYLDCLFSGPQFEQVLSPLPELDRDSAAICSALKNLDFSSLLLLGGTGGRPLKKMMELPQVERATCVELDYALAESAYQFFQDNQMKANVYLYHHLYASDDNTRKLLLSDVVIANDIINQVKTAQRYRADSLCNAVTKVTRKYALVTCYPYKKQNPNFDEDGAAVISSMMEAFQCFFNLLDVIELGQKGTESFALLLVGEKK